MERWSAAFCAVLFLGKATAALAQNPPDIRLDDAFAAAKHEFVRRSASADRLNQSAFKIYSNLDEADLHFALGSASHSALPDNAQLGNFCSNIASVPVVVRVGRWLPHSIDDVRRCSGSEIFSAAMVSPKFVEFPIAIRGFLPMTERESVLPTWITREHIAAAALANLPEGDFSLPEAWVQSRVCKPKDLQPAPADLQKALDTASCSIIDADGRRRIGEFPAVLRTSRDSHAAGPLADTRLWPFATLRFPENKTENWNQIDAGIRSTPISIFTPSADGVESSRIQRTILQSLCDGLSRSIQTPREIDEWRRAGGCSALRPQTSSVQYTKDLLSTGLLLTSISDYVQALKFNLPRSNLYSYISPQRMIGNDTPAPWLAKALLANQYPGAQVIWVYANPNRLSEENIKSFLDKIFNEGSSRDYEGSLAFLKDIIELKDKLR
ncbi:hypothetical protein [Teichococcus aestuarii]|uniref:hypothetical protein n=1 Tax=Teichococcus aestuarii TaxID=568898 RepID=UPI0011B209C8|nr:hypothetical protein [Pseudoroseomonas aestuarii]